MTEFFPLIAAACAIWAFGLIAGLALANFLMDRREYRDAMARQEARTRRLIDAGFHH